MKKGIKNFLQTEICLSRQLFIKAFFITTIFAFGVTGGFLYAQKTKPQTLGVSIAIEQNKYIAFLSEIYDKIKENHWEKISDEQLTNLFALGIEKLIGQPQNLKKYDKENLVKILETILPQIESEEKKKEFTAQLADVVLVNLKPFGRSRLYSTKEEKELANNVKNINPEVNHYESLDVDKKAPQEEIEKAYLEQVEKLEAEKDTSPEAKQKYEEVNRAYEVLKDEETRKVYDISGIEPTLSYKLIRPDIFYIHITKMSPTTLEELKRVTEKVDNQEGLDSLIVDLRDNIGGSIDNLTYFLGPFIGNNQYAFQFFHQGETTDFKTRIGYLPSLVRYKKVVVLINGGTQSSAEVIAATFKKYNAGVIVGTLTKGWGTVERVLSLESQLDPNEKYSVFIAHSLTLREDNQPIEGAGVEPTININNSDWEKQLYAYFHYDELTAAVKEVLNEKN